MTDQLLRRGRGLWRAAQSVVALSAIIGAGAASGCLNRPLEPADSRTTSTIVERLTQSSVDKIDLVLAIDNSRSMADKQQILVDAVPDLVRGLVNPKCLDPQGVPAQDQPTGPTEECPAGTKREFEPVLDIHIGIISSSLGGHGADACLTTETTTCGAGKPNVSNNDAGHLLARKDPCGGQNVPTYNEHNFLAWDPAQKLMPPGESKIGDQPGDTSGIVPSLRDMVLGVGQVGCGYEAQLESWYRFLVDPEPYKEIVIEGGKAVPKDIDDVLLQQRADFLRPSSLLAIIMLTDENDCSIKEYGQFYYAAQQRQPGDSKKTFRLPRARKECALNPNDKCCRSCGQKADDCPPDDTCTMSPTLSDAEDDINLRCFDQKRRFGIDFLYEIDRYTQALTSLSVKNRQGDLVPNPIYTDLNPNDQDSNVRDPGLVFLAGIVGVPWQDIARQDPNGKPDLLTGLNKDQKAVGGFKTYEELSAKINDTDTGWDVILGDPKNYVPPKDPLMIESVGPRVDKGVNPITGDALQPPGSGTKNPINGSEYTIDNDDLQYACIFDLLPNQQRDCTQGLVSCDCQDADNDNPLCDPNPAKNGERTLQTRAKAYPGIRELAALKSLGPQGIVASVCPAQIGDNTKPDYGYRPAIGAIIDRLKVALGGQCLPRSLRPDSKGQVQCIILEARKTDGQCNCDPNKARLEPPPEHAQAVAQAKSDESAKTAGWDCFCEIEQLTGDELDKCQTDLNNPPILDGNNVNGWCYIDATTSPPTGNVEIVKNCPDTERRLIRFVGEGNPNSGGTLFITCAGD